MYLDENKLYGCGMSGYLPYVIFKWLENDDSFYVTSVSENSSIGYFLKVDLEYPNELQDFHNDYPLAQEKLKILYDLLSSYCKKLQMNMEQKLMTLKN